MTPINQARLLAGETPEILEIEQSVERSLAERMRAHESYRPSEIEEIAVMKRTLLPAGMKLSKEATEEFRMLAKFSQAELRLSPTISSHRKFVGPLIVFIKKLTWPLIYFHLKDTFAGMREFHARVLYSLSRQYVEIEKLKADRPSNS